MSQMRLRVVRKSIVATAKPPYCVPSMRAIAAMPSNGLTVVSTFSGCGGSCLGFRMAGYRALWASEFIEAARICYAANSAKGTILDGRDIREVDPRDILKAVKKKQGQIDVLEGSPPCASFSLLGKRNEHWGAARKYSETVQRTDDLFFEYIRILRGLRPKVFVAENVSGLVRGVSKGYFVEVFKAMRDVGYVVESKLLDAQWLGVPQARQRIIFMGVRDDLGKSPSFPTPLPYRYSMREAIPELADTTRTMSALVLGNLNKHKVAATHFPRGQKHSFDQPCMTIMAVGIGSVRREDHYLEGAEGQRPFTIDELKRICSYPDDFVLLGTHKQQWERLGRSVPPLMMRAVAERIRDDILA